MFGFISIVDKAAILPVGFRSTHTSKLQAFVGLPISFSACKEKYDATGQYICIHNMYAFHLNSRELKVNAFRQKGKAFLTEIVKFQKILQISASLHANNRGTFSLPAEPSRQLS